MNTQTSKPFRPAAVLPFLSGRWIEPQPAEQVSEDWGVEVPYLFFTDSAVLAEPVAA